MHSFILHALLLSDDLVFPNWLVPCKLRAWTVSCTYDFTLWHSILLLLVLGTPLDEVLFFFLTLMKDAVSGQFLLPFLQVVVNKWGWIGWIESGQDLSAYFCQCKYYMVKSNRLHQDSIPSNNSDNFGGNCQKYIKNKNWVELQKL